MVNDGYASASNPEADVCLSPDRAFRSETPVFPHVNTPFNSSVGHACGHFRYRSAFRSYGDVPASAKLPAYMSVLSGSFSGMTAAAATYPLDLIRGRLAGILLKDNEGRALSTIRSIFQSDGIRGFYRGLTSVLFFIFAYSILLVAASAIFFVPVLKTHTSAERTPRTCTGFGRCFHAVLPGCF